MEIEMIPDFDLEVADVVVDDIIVGQENDSAEKDVISEEESNKEETHEEDERVYGEDADPVAVATFEQLVEEGILNNDDEFDGSWDKLKENLSTLPQRVLNTIVASKSDISKDVIRFAFSSDNISKEEMINFMKTNLEESIESTTIETMDDAREYLEKVYQEKGMKPKVIEAALASLEEDGELLNEAKEELEKKSNSLKDKPKTEALIKDKETQTAQLIEQRTNFVKSLAEELTNVGWKQSKVDEVKNRINNNNVNPVLKDIFNNPKAFIKLVDFIGYYKNGDIEYDKFINSIETPKVKDIKTRIENAVNSPTLSTKSNLKTTNVQVLEPVFD